MLFAIKTLKGIIENADLIIKSAEISPIFDPMFKIFINENEDEHNVVMMGNGITKSFLKLLKLEQQKTNKGCGKYLKLAPDIESDDIDLYFLKPENLMDISTNNIKNIIHTKSSITDLVIDRFLPCDRIASNSKKDIFHVSLQCLYSLLTGNCFIPQYLHSIDNFITHIYNDKYINDKTKNNCHNMFDNFNSSIKIYEKYGYTFQYINTKTVLSCILSQIQH